MSVDHPTPQEDAIGVFMSALRAKVTAMVKEGFEGWEGEITCRNYTLKVDLSLERRE